MTKISTPQLLSMRTVADILGVSLRTVQRLVSCRKLQAHRVRPRLVRIAEKDLEEFLKKHRGPDENDDIDANH